MNIRQAAIACDIYYPTAKAINKIYRQTGRVEKIVYRCKPNNNVQAVLIARQQAEVRSAELPASKSPLKKVPDCENVWVFDGATKPQEKALTSESEKPIQNEHSESSRHVFQNVAGNEVAAGEHAQISNLAVQSAKPEEFQHNIAVDNLDTMDNEINDESYFERPSFNFRTYLKGQAPLVGSAGSALIE